MQFPFDAKLAKDLSKLKEQIAAARQSLYALRVHECVCDANSLCAHHAEVDDRLEEVSRQLDLAISLSQSIRKPRGST